MSEVDIEAIMAGLPEAIWIPSPGSSALPKVYRGSPVEIVEAMASKAKPKKRTVRSAVKYLVMSIAKTRKVEIHLPGGLDEDELAGLFVFALLDTGLGKPLPQA